MVCDRADVALREVVALIIVRCIHYWSGAESSKTRGRRRAVPALQFERLGTPRRDDGVRYTL